MEPTKEETQWLWEQCGFSHSEKTYHYELTKKVMDWIRPDGELSYDDSRHKGHLPPIDLNSLFRYSPNWIVGITFRYYPGGVECELTYITEAGFETEEIFLSNSETEGHTEENSRKKSALALFWAIYKALEVVKDERQG